MERPHVWKASKDKPTSRDTIVRGRVVLTSKNWNIYTGKIKMWRCCLFTQKLRMRNKETKNNEFQPTNMWIHQKNRGIVPTKTMHWTSQDCDLYRGLAPLVARDWLPMPIKFLSDLVFLRALWLTRLDGWFIMNTSIIFDYDGLWFMKVYEGLWRFMKVYEGLWRLMMMMTMTMMMMIQPANTGGPINRNVVSMRKRSGKRPVFQRDVRDKWLGRHLYIDEPANYQHGSPNRNPKVWKPNGFGILSPY